VRRRVMNSAWIRPFVSVMTVVGIAHLRALRVPLIAFARFACGS
jgi:hypothetical protein